MRRSGGVIATEHPMSVHDEMIHEYEKKKASLQHQIITLGFGHIGVCENFVGTHTTNAIEAARHEIAAIDAAMVSCRDKAKRAR
jgi:hypothetical protein